MSLIGAVTAEMVVGAGGWDSGLASRMMEGSFRMDIPRMYAALALLVASGVLIHLFLCWLVSSFVGTAASCLGVKDELR
ncbi:MAG: hypothetical protein LRY49_04260 [Burkholderiaceae bacterium]|nr:hypothetical protein [Burkholderiaceae bacterium]